MYHTYNSASLNVTGEICFHSFVSGDVEMVMVSIFLLFFSTNRWTQVNGEERYFVGERNIFDNDGHDDEWFQRSFKTDRLTTGPLTTM